MRSAILADIHGNSLALDAVLADIQARGGVDHYWILGDLCALGYDPAGVVKRLAALLNAISVRGNADRYVVSGQFPPPTVTDVQADPSLAFVLAQVAGNFGWTVGHLKAANCFDWLAALPLDYRLTLPDGTRVLLFHAHPSSDEGPGLNPTRSDDEIQAEIADTEADLICVGHFHMAMNRRMNGIHIINPGSVSNPQSSTDLRPAYALLEADTAGYNIAFHQVDYDVEAALEATRQSRNPGAEFNLRCLQGQVVARWLSNWNGITHAAY
jgi:predicted phosphodiesterase